MGARLLDYQVPHFTKLLASLSNHGLAHDGSETGTGKTYVGAALLKTFNQGGRVVCPLSVVPSWRDALDAFGVPGVEVVNYERAWRRCGEVKPWGTGSFFKWHEPSAFTVFDEAHRCGGETSINSKMMIASTKINRVNPAHKVMTLSATIASSPIRMKAFGFMMGLHENRDFRDFLLKCNCKPGTFGGWTWSAKQNGHIMSFLHEMIYGAGKGARMIRSEIPGFPQTTTDVRIIPDVDKQVLRLGEELRGRYNERSVAAHQTESELARMIFLRQALETAKVPFICDMVEDALEHSRVVVFCNFTETINALCDKATKKGWTHATITGDQTTSEAKKRERYEIVKSYQRNEYDVLFCNIQAGGAGISLHDATTKVPRTSIICPTFSAEDLKQVLGRVHRSEGGFSRQHLVYFGDSLEGAVARVVKTKLGNLDLLNDNELSGDFRMAA